MGGVSSQFDVEPTNYEIQEIERIIDVMKEKNTNFLYVNYS